MGEGNYAHTPDVDAGGRMVRRCQNPCHKVPAILLNLWCVQRALVAGAHLLLDVLGYSKPVGLKQIATIQFVLCRFAVESGNRGGQRDGPDEMSGLLRYAKVFEREEHGQHLSSKDRSARAHAARKFIAGGTSCQNSEESLGLLLSLCRHVDDVDVSPRTFLARLHLRRVRGSLFPYVKVIWYVRPLIILECGQRIPYSRPADALRAREEVYRVTQDNPSFPTTQTSIKLKRGCPGGRNPSSSSVAALRTSQPLSRFLFTS